MATHAEIHSTQGPQGPAGPAPTDSGRKVLATPSDGSSGVASLRRIVPADVVADTLVDGYLVNYQSGDGLLHVSDPGTITGLSAIKIRGVTVATAATAPRHQDLLSYDNATATWILRRPVGGNQAGWRASGLAGMTVSFWGFSTTLQLSGTGAAVASSATEPMYTSVTTSSSPTQAASVDDTATNKNCFGIFRRFKTRIQLPSTASIRVWAVMTDDHTLNSTWKSDAPVAKYVGFRFHSGTDAGWVGVAGTDGTHQSFTTVGPAIDTAGHDLEVLYDGTQAIFLVDGAVIGTTYSLTTNLPATSAGLSIFVSVDNVGAGNAKTMNLANLFMETV
jgi:hypothetical protein